VAVVATLLVLMLALPGMAGAGSRIPVNSTDDTASPAANRIDAVTNIVLATNARLTRVMTAYPPNPCAEISALCPAALSVVGAYSTLGHSVACALEAVYADGPGDAVITDADAYAADISTNGILNQLASIATVLGNADDRLGGIRVPNPGPPEAPEAAALNALALAIADGGSAAADWLGTEYPPNPCEPPAG
jgi:hypothetical protein